VYTLRMLGAATEMMPQQRDPRCVRFVDWLFLSVAPSAWYHPGILIDLCLLSNRKRPDRNEVCRPSPTKTRVEI
jgi:hypothetical protein